MWDLRCLDWETRIREGRSLIPDLPLIESQATWALKLYDELRLPDVAGLPRLGDASGQWFRDLVRAAFGSWDPVDQRRYIRDIFVLAPKGQSKTSYSAAMMIVAMLMNKRPRAEMLFVGPTQAIADRAYEQAVGMVEASPHLKRQFRTRDHIKTIEDLSSQSEMKVKTFDPSILTGSILSFCLLDELHLLHGARAPRVITQIRGGLAKTKEGLLLITSTQSDEVPSGAFKEELLQARMIRDGKLAGKNIRAMLPVLYEFPRDIARDPAKWQDSDNWPMVMPNLGKSVDLPTVVQSWETARTKGDVAITNWASQFLNIEIGIGLKTDGWAGAEFWQQGEDVSITLESIKERCEVVVVGVDGGGLDDLFGLCVIGRDRETKHWLCWTHAWCHRGVLKRRQTIAARLLEFEEQGDLTIVDDKLDDISAIIAITQDLKDAGILACVAVDPAGLGQFVEELKLIGITAEAKHVIGVAQGYAMMNAMKTSERKLANGTLRHSVSRLMDWCVSNVKIEALATAIRATKQNAGDAKIDPWAAMQNAVAVMRGDPVPMREPEFQMLLLA